MSLLEICHLEFLHDFRLQFNFFHHISGGQVKGAVLLGILMHCLVHTRHSDMVGFYGFMASHDRCAMLAQPENS